MKEREIKYDFLRAVAVIAIMMVHAIPAVSVNDKQWWFAAVMQPLLLSFVGIYFMLSGMFLLDSATGDIMQFYKKRVKVIVIPFLFFSVLYYLYDVSRSLEVLSWWEYPLEFLRDFLSGTVPMADHMWFMYVIIALYLCTPFLARMMKAMNDQELTCFIQLILGVQTLTNYAGGLGIGLDQILTYMVFQGWLIYYVLGYALKRLFQRKDFKWFAFAGILGLVLTLLQKRFTPGFVPGIHDLAPTMIAMSAAVFLLFECWGNLRFKAARTVITWLSRHSYSAYLAHYLILKVAAEPIVDQTMVRHFYVPRIVCTTLLTAVLSFAAAWLLDGTVIKWLQKFVKTDTGKSIKSINVKWKE